MWLIKLLQLEKYALNISLCKYCIELPVTCLLKNTFFFNWKLYSLYLTNSYTSKAYCNYYSQDVDKAMVSDSSTTKSQEKKTEGGILPSSDCPVGNNSVNQCLTIFVLPLFIFSLYLNYFYARFVDNIRCKLAF